MILGYTNEHVDLYPVIYTTLVVFRKKKSPGNLNTSFEWKPEELRGLQSVCIHLFEIRMFEIHHNVSILCWSTLGWRKKFLEKNFYCTHQQLPTVSPWLFQVLHIYSWDPLKDPASPTNWHLPWAPAICLYKDWIKCSYSCWFSTLLRRSSETKTNTVY